MNRFENRLNTNLKKWHILNPVWDNEKEDALNVFKMIDLLNKFGSENKKLEKENGKLKDSLNFCKENVKRLHDDKKELINENEQLKQELFETSKELLLETSSEIDRVLYYEDEVEELRKEIFND